MSRLAQAILAGITSFIATNIDDIILLTLFFAQVNRTLRPKHIVIGQYLGFTALVIASLPGFFGGLIVPKEWIGLLGLIPVGIGIKKLLKREEEKTQIQAVSGELNRLKANLLTPQTLSVASVTFANGGDNIGIYVPLFASSDLASLGVILSIFFLMIGVWCYIAYYLTRQPTVALVLNRYGQRIVPFVLIGLGIFILIESGTYRLLPPFQQF